MIKRAIERLTRPSMLGRFSFIFLSGVLAFNANHVAAANTNHTPEQSGYIEQYVHSINTNDADLLKRLWHPSFRECINKSTPLYFDDYLQKALSRQIPQDYATQIDTVPVEVIEREFSGAKVRGLPYPMRPSHQLTLNYNRSEYDSVTIYRYLVYENGRFFEISGCPNAQMLEKYRQLKIKKQQEAKRALTLYQSLDKALIEEFKVLLAQGEKIKAWKKYSDISGESLGTAKLVLWHLDQSDD